MKVKVVCSNEKYDMYKEKLEKAGFIVTDDASLAFVDYEDKVQLINAKKDGDLYRVPIEKILFVESYGHEISINLMDDTYYVREKLYELEIELKDYKFIRINKSQIINVGKIKKMKALLNYRIKITLINDKVVYVSRNYYYAFKDFLGL